MTALDQAFIKAFTRQSESPWTVLPPTAAPTPSVALRPEDEGPTATKEAPPAAPPLPAIDGVWAALEKQPRAAASRLKMDAARGGGKLESGTCCLEQSTFSLPPLPPPVAPSLQSHIPSPAPLVFSPQPPAADSFFTTVAPPPASRGLTPAWQVDHFTWPKLCRRLMARAANELDQLADSLLAANARGQKVLAVAGCRRGEGATSLLLCAARRLAERGIKPVLVDADLDQPELANRLGVQPQLGWDETTDEEGKLLDQAIVEATANNVALLPAREPSTQSARPASDVSRLPICLRALRNHYDVVLLDLGPLEDLGLSDGVSLQAIAGMIDAVLLVHNRQLTSDKELSALADQMTAAGIAVAGIVENFVAE